jgi:hypothetical protein
VYALAYPILAYVYHGNAGSGRSIGIESEGVFNGAPGGPKGEPSDLLIETTRAACTFAVAQAAQEGALIRYYAAHRQHAASRRGDPGWRLWQAVYIDHCERKLGLRLSEETTRDGRPIPASWDARQAAAY